MKAWEIIARILLFLLGVAAAADWTRQGKVLATLTPNQLVFLLTLFFLSFSL